MTEAEDAKLQAFRDRLLTEQRRLLLQAAESDCLPPSGMLAKISDLEHAIVATDEMLEEFSYQLSGKTNIGELSST